MDSSLRHQLSVGRHHRPLPNHPADPQVIRSASRLLLRSPACGVLTASISPSGLAGIKA
jgi:hypothetical protein